MGSFFPLSSADLGISLWNVALFCPTVTLIGTFSLVGDLSLKVFLRYANGDYCFWVVDVVAGLSANNSFIFSTIDLSSTLIDLLVS